LKKKQETPQCDETRFSTIQPSIDVTGINKRAQRALGRSPEEKVKGHSGSNNREPQGHNLNNFG